jgi:5-methylcytosine-specific restriction endonuclease McrA
MRSRATRRVEAAACTNTSAATSTPRRQGEVDVTSPNDLARRRLIAGAFQMPSAATMVSRTSTITNAFVSSVIPTIPPTPEEVGQALQVLEMEPHDVRCAYCGDKSSEWDHLRPLVLNRRPTGFITEIANLVPACGKCNQSKGNKPWRDWMLSKARLSPTGRGVADVEARIARLSAYEQWRSPMSLDFAAIVGSEEWEKYWSLCQGMIAELARCQQVADSIRERVLQSLRRG